MECRKKLTLRISAETELAAAVSASDVEAEAGDVEILFIHGLLFGIELGTTANESTTTAIGASHGERDHQSNLLRFVDLRGLATLTSDARIEVRGIPLGRDLSFSHDEKWIGGRRDGRREEGKVGRWEAQCDINLPYRQHAVGGPTF